MREWRTDEARKEKRPDIDRTDVVFAEGGVSFCIREDGVNGINPSGKTLEAQLEEAFDDAESKDRRYVYVGKFSKQFIEKLNLYVQIKDYPVVMNYRDAYISMRSKAEGKYKGDGINYHNLGVGGLKNALESLGSPEYVLLQPNKKKIEFILNGEDYKRRQLFAIVEINTRKQHSQKYLNVHVVTSAYGNRSIKNRIETAAKEGRLIYNKNEELSQGMPQVQYERDINDNSSTDSIPNSAENVKQNNKKSLSSQNTAPKKNGEYAVYGEDVMLEGEAKPKGKAEITAPTRESILFHRNIRTALLTHPSVFTPFPPIPSL